MIRPAWIFLLIALGLLFNSQSYAQSVSTVKGSKVLVELGSMDLNPGDRVFALDEEGRRKALLEILQSRDGKAVAKIVKGSPQVGYTLAPAKKAPARASSRKAAPPEETQSYVPRKSGQAWGLTAAVMMNTMKISSYDQGGTSYSFDMTGTNFGVGGFYDYPLTREFFVRAHGTFEMFDVQKKYPTAICNDLRTTDCNANFMQLGAYGSLNYVFSPAPYRFWAGGGGGVLLYASKESTVVDTNKLFFNTVLMAATGIDFFSSNRTTFFPVAFEYQMIPSKEAAVTSLVLRAGWGKSF